MKKDQMQIWASIQFFVVITGLALIATSEALTGFPLLASRKKGGKEEEGEEPPQHQQLQPQQALRLQPLQS